MNKLLWFWSILHRLKYGYKVPVINYKDLHVPNKILFLRNLHRYLIEMNLLVHWISIVSLMGTAKLIIQNLL